MVPLSAATLDDLRANYPDCLLGDGFEDAIIGIVDGACREPVVCYDYDECVEILMRDGMDEIEACEYMDFNVVGAYVGEMTPLFLHDWRREDGSP